MCYTKIKRLIFYKKCEWVIIMTFNQYINRRRKELGMTVDELVERSGLPKGTVSKITSGINANPKLTTIEAICRALMCSVDDAMGLAPAASIFSYSEIEKINKYRSLDKYGKDVMDSILDIEYERCYPSQLMITRPYYAVSVSAGYGNPLDEPPEEDIEIPDTPENRKGDYVVRVSGNSMTPLFNDGDMVLVEKDARVEEGEIGIFVLNGESYIKKQGVDELISINPAYPPRPYSRSDSIQCCGKVICRLKKNR